MNQTKPGYFSHTYFSFAFLFAAVLAFSGCSHGYVFKEMPPVTKAGDQKPSPLPEYKDLRLVETAVASSVRYPVDQFLSAKRPLRSQDVNSMDQVPASSWFTPRLGFETLRPETLVKGPEEKGPPQLPLTITKTKNEGNSPGFVVNDARGLKYLIKFDQVKYVSLESTVNYVVDRLFWGFGYNVPEDFTLHFSKSDVTPGEGVDPQKIEKVFRDSRENPDGTYRAVASLFLEGKVLGHIPLKGKRADDWNDTIDHENRRTLRALKVFCAFLDNTGMRSDNSLDVYVGEPGQGHTVHYLLDFGEAFGAHGLEKEWNWDGFEHVFSFRDTFFHFMNFGIPVRPWERLSPDLKNPAWNFEADAFDPGAWKEVVQFLPMRSSLPEDDYWAAKILAGLEPEHLDALLGAAQHPDPVYVESIKNILMKRRDKILTWAYGQVSPLEAEGLESGRLRLTDLSEQAPGLITTGYEVRFLNQKGNVVAPMLQMPPSRSLLEIPITDALLKANGYLRVEVTSLHAGKKTPPPAQFHIRQSSGGHPTLVGIVH